MADLFGQQPGDGDTQAAGAWFDPTGQYRYHLWRRPVASGTTVLWVMLNPSTADASQLDPTLRRCRGFTKDWGYQNFEVVNLFAWKSTRPSGIYRVADPIGPDNDRAIQDAAAKATCIVAAWGGRGGHLGRAGDVLRMLRATGQPIWCLGLTMDGMPKHPLYVPADVMAQALP